MRSTRYELSAADRGLPFSALAAEKYSTWDWNYGQSPEYDIKKEYRFDGGGLSIYLKVNKGVIQSARIFGDYFGAGEISDVEERLQSVTIREDAVKAALSGLEINDYIHGLDLDTLAHFYRGINIYLPGEFLPHISKNAHQCLCAFFFSLITFVLARMRPYIDSLMEYTMTLSTRRPSMSTTSKR